MTGIGAQGLTHGRRPTPGHIVSVALSFEGLGGFRPLHDPGNGLQDSPLKDEATTWRSGLIIGVIGNTRLVENKFPAQLVGETHPARPWPTWSARQAADVRRSTPEITDVGALLDSVDGILLTGGRANVHPSRFGVEPHPRHEPYDEKRDALALALVEVCVERAVPLLGICRGLQEMNVAYGGTLHPEIRELPGRENHRMPRLENGEIHPDLDVIFGDRHDVHLTSGGMFATIFGRDTIRVNSLARAGASSDARRSASSSRATPTTAPSRRSASPMRRASRSASSGTLNTTRSAIRSTGRCSMPSAKRSRRIAEPAQKHRRARPRKLVAVSPRISTTATSTPL